MRFTETGLNGAFVIDLEKRHDDRGFFARAWCRREFEVRGLNAVLVQANLAFSRRQGTLRGLHYQVPPHEEAKLVRCVLGAICDVIVDLRPASSSYLRWFSIELTADNHRMIYVPEGFAHGYQTLTDEALVFYHVSTFYAPEFERGLRWNDPAVGVEWPAVGRRWVSDRDAAWPDFGPDPALRDLPGDR